MTFPDLTWAKAHPEDRGHATPCLVWDRGRYADGYGCAYVPNPDGGRALQKRAHVAIYEALVGPVPEGWEVDHLCRVRDCIEPTHLEAVTKAENLRRQAAARTTCPQGHAYDGVKSYRTKAGERRTSRRCMTCHRVEEGKRMKRNRKVAA